MDLFEGGVKYLHRLAECFVQGQKWPKTMKRASSDTLSGHLIAKYYQFA